jgi:hypothetical protein
MDNFWDEETAKEYGKFCVLNNSWLQWEDFKKSKEGNKGYEIIDYETHHWEPNYDKSHTIKSVRRLMGKEQIFTVGDNTTHGIINSFEIIDNSMYAKCSRGIFNINDIEKVKKEQFFTTDQEHYIKLLIRRILNEISPK